MSNLRFIERSEPGIEFLSEEEVSELNLARQDEDPATVEAAIQREFELFYLLEQRKSEAVRSLHLILDGDGANDSVCGTDGGGG
jgi:hypothetical protein